MTKDNVFNWRFCLCCGIFIWFVVNLLQGVFTEINEDEAYYALFGEHLAWGYFDHPPMVGLMTFLSGKLFSGLLGVRFFTVVASCLTLYVVWLTANPSGFISCNSDKAPKTAGSAGRPTLRNVLLFFTVACSVVMFNIYGFVTTPDAGLMLFSALFLFVYQRYLAEKSWPRALLMGLLMACMVYSKYHAFLLLGLVVLSNPRLLSDGKFWVACLVSLMLLTPHILWQIDAGFPSFRYHLTQRSEAFRWSYFFEYLPNQLLVFNPFTFGAVVYVMLKRERLTPSIVGQASQYGVANAQEDFERGLRFILVGFFFFFWLMAFRGHVEPHWTAICFIPAVVLVYRKALADVKLRLYIGRFVLPSLLLVAFMRVALLTPLSAPFGFYGKESHFRAVESVAGSRPVVFQGSFQYPALYHYFTGKGSSTLRCYYDRATQYDLWQFDKDWLGKQVVVYGSATAQAFQVGDESFSGALTDNFQTANRLKMQFALASDKPIVHPSDTLHFDFSIYNPCEQSIEFQPEMMLKLLLVDGNGMRYGHYDPIVALQPGETQQGRFSVVLGPETGLGKQRLLLCIGDRYALFGNLQDAVEVDFERP